MQEVGHIISVLERVKRAIKIGDVGETINLSNQTIHTSSIYQDPDNIALSVILYSLGKIIERKKYQDYPEWNKFERTYQEAITNSIIALKRDNLEEYRFQISRIRDSIKKLSGSLKNYIEEIFKKARVNKASKIYEHGISLEKTAKMLGLSQWELAEYIGQSNTLDIDLTYTKEIKERIGSAEEIFS